MLVEIRNQMQRDTVKEDRILLEQQKQRIQQEIQLERENLNKKKTLAKELLDMSMKDKELRNQMRKRRRQNEDQAFKDKLESMERTDKEMKMLQKQEKHMKNKEIQDYYQNHLELKKEMERLERARDKEYLQMGIDKLEREENDRIDFFKKIKNGYKQNHLVQKKYQDYFRVGRGVG